MSRFFRTLALPIVPLALTMGVLGMIDGNGNGAAAGSNAVDCEIRVTDSGGMVTLEGMVYAKRAVSGSYRLEVFQGGDSGTSVINQGGSFSAGPGDANSLGIVTLGSDGRSTYVAKLKVNWNGGSAKCVERAGGSL